MIDMYVLMPEKTKYAEDIVNAGFHAFAAGLAKPCIDFNEFGRTMVAGE